MRGEQSERTRGGSLRGSFTARSERRARWYARAATGTCTHLHDDIYLKLKFKMRGSESKCEQEGFAQNVSGKSINPYLHDPGQDALHRERGVDDVRRVLSVRFG